MYKKFGILLGIVCGLTLPLFSMKDESVERKVPLTAPIEAGKPTPEALDLAQSLAKKAYKNGLRVRLKENGSIHSGIGSGQSGMGDLIRPFVKKSFEDVFLKMLNGIFTLSVRHQTGDSSITVICDYDSDPTKRSPGSVEYRTSLDALIVYGAAYHAIKENNVLAVQALALHNARHTQWLKGPLDAYPFFKKSALQVARECWSEKSQIARVLEAFERLYKQTSNAYVLFGRELEKLSGDVTFE